ncbi:MAG: tetratricopeptide repeat protein [Mangrovibacterium sp.]
MKLKRIAIVPIVALALSSCASKQAVVKSNTSESEYKETAISETPLSQEQKSEFEYVFIEALKKKQTGNVDAAQQLFARCLEIDPLSAVSMYEMGKLHYQKKDLTSAALLFERTVDINPNNRWYKITLAQTYQQAGKYDNAAQLYSELYLQNKEEQQYLYTEAVLWSMAKNYKESLKTYDQFAKVTGKYEAVALAKQSVYQQSGDLTTAIKEMEKLIKQHPKNTTYYGLVAELYNKQGNDEKALEYYNKIFDISPDNGLANVSLASFYLEKDDKEKAFNYVKKAFQSENLDVDTKIQFYLADVDKGDDSAWTSEQIDELLTILHDMYPDDERMFAVYADRFMRQGKIEEARENIQKYLAKNSNTYEMWWQYLMLSNQLQDWQRLLTDSEEALGYFPEEATVYMWKAMAELQMESYESAIETAKKGLEYAGDNAYLNEQLQVFIADANYELGNIDEAISAYAEVVKNNPTNYGALNNYAYYLSEVGRDLDKAEACANKVVQANPANATYLDTYAWVLFKKGDYALAKFYQETAIEKDESGSGVFYEHYGDILSKLGDEAGALKQWKKAKEAGDASELLDEKIEQKTYLEE